MVMSITHTYVDQVEPNQPSSKARELSYSKFNGLIDLLNSFKLLSDWNEDSNHFHILMKDFVMRHTPLDKRGGPKRGVK